MRKRFLFIYFFILFLKPATSFSLVEIDITRGNLDPLPISVSPFFADNITNEKNIPHNQPLILVTKTSIFYNARKDRTN